MKTLLLTLVCLASTGFAQPIEITTNRIETQGEKRGVYVYKEGIKKPLFIEVQLHDPSETQLFPSEGGDSNILIVKDPELSHQIYEKLNARSRGKFAIQESDGTISVTKKRTQKTVYTLTSTKADSIVKKYEDFRRAELKKLEEKKSPSKYDFELIEKEKEALARVETFRPYLKEIVSGKQNRCWLRSSWRVILEEAFYNDDFYNRLMNRIEDSRKIIRFGNYIPGKLIIQRWIKIVKALKENPGKRLEIMNTEEFDDALSDYGRNLVYSLGKKSTDHGQDQILKPDSEGSFLDSKAFFDYFNIDAETMSAGLKNPSRFNKYIDTANYKVKVNVYDHDFDFVDIAISRLGRMRGERDKDTIFTDRYVLNGVPGHWDLLKKPE